MAVLEDAVVVRVAAVAEGAGAQPGDVAVVESVMADRHPQPVAMELIRYLPLQKMQDEAQRRAGQRGFVLGPFGRFESTGSNESQAQTFVYSRN